MTPYPQMQQSMEQRCVTLAKRLQINSARRSRRLAVNLSPALTDGGSAGHVSDNAPGILPMLRIRLENLSLALHAIKSANPCARRNDRAGLERLSFSKTQIDDLLTSETDGSMGFSHCLLTFGYEEVSRLTARIAAQDAVKYLRKNPDALANADAGLPERSPSILRHKKFACCRDYRYTCNVQPF